MIRPTDGHRLILVAGRWSCIAEAIPVNFGDRCCRDSIPRVGSIVDTDGRPVVDLQPHHRNEIRAPVPTGTRTTISIMEYRVTMTTGCSLHRGRGTIPLPRLSVAALPPIHPAEDLRTVMRACGGTPCSAAAR